MSLNLIDNELVHDKIYNKKIDLRALSLLIYITGLLFFNGTIMFYLTTMFFILINLILIVKDNEFYIPAYFSFITIFIIFNFILILFNNIPFRSISMNRNLILTLNSIIGLLIINLFTQRKTVKYVVSLFPIILFIFLIFIIFLDFNNIFNGRLAFNLKNPFGSGTYNSNIIGYFICVCLLMSIIDLKFFRPSIKKLVLFRIFYYVLFLILLGGRKTFIYAMLIIFSSYFYSSNNMKNRFKKIFIILLTISVLLAVVTIVPIFYDIIGFRLVDIFKSVFLNEELTESSAVHRSIMIDIAKELIKEKPWLGYGLDSFSQLSPYKTYSHNNYLELILSSGYVGLTLYYLTFLFFFIKVLFLRDKYIRYFFSSIILFFLILDYSVVSYMSREIMLIIYMTFGLTNMKGKYLKYDQII